MIKTFLTLGLLAAIGSGCATLSPSPLATDDPANPEAADIEDASDSPALLAGSEPLARWLATNRVDASQSEHQHGQTPAPKPQQPKQHQHDH